MSDEVEVIGFSRIHLREAQRSARRAAKAGAEGSRDTEAGATAAAILLAAAATEALLWSCRLSYRSNRKIAMTFEMTGNPPPRKVPPLR